MILLLGASGYIGQAFERELQRRGQPFRSVQRAAVDYTRFDTLLSLLREAKPSFVINAAGYTGKPNVDACENDRAGTLQGNTLLPQTIAHACQVAEVPWGHLSSGCIYSGARIVDNGASRIEKDLTQPGARQIVETNPSAVRGYTEADEPNFSFRQPPCSFYSGSKALGEEAIAGLGQSYIWRIRLPFDELDNGRNYISKLLRYSKIYDNVNSLSQRSDCARACLNLWEKRAPFGTYNIVNPGFVTTRQVVGQIERILKPARAFEFWKSDEEFYRVAAKTPRSNCVLDASKLLAAGVNMPPVEEALVSSLKNWQWERT